MVFREGDSNETERAERIDPPNDEEDTKVRLDVEEDEHEDTDDEEKTPNERPDADGKPRNKNGTWAGKKAERGKERKAARAWETEKADLQRQMRLQKEDHERSIAHLREDLERSTRRDDRAGPDPFTTKLKDIDEQLDQELKLIESDQNRGYGRYRQLNDQRVELLAQRAIMSDRMESQRRQQNQPQDPYASRRPFIESEYPWVMDNQYRELAQAARAYKQYLVAVEGKPDTLDTDREALSYIQSTKGQQYGMRPPPAAPSQRTRSLYGSPGSRSTPDRRPPPREVDLGVMGHGHGLSPDRLRRAVNGALSEDD